MSECRVADTRPTESKWDPNLYYQLWQLRKHSNPDYALQAADDY